MAAPGTTDWRPEGLDRADPTVADPTVVDPTVVDPTVVDPTVVDPEVADADPVALPVRDEVPPALLIDRRRPSRRRRRADRHLRRVLAGRQRLILAVLILGWTALTALAWSWWLAPSNLGNPVGLVINSILLAVESILLPAWFFFWIWRMRRVDRTLDVPDLRTAMVVTKAPSEPWPVVRETLLAMLAQDFPFPYDVWLADESPDTKTYLWCLEHGVRMSTREGVPEYHRATWPRRTRCKEGNLAYFYDMWGYELYDVVAQLDADHVPTPDYLSKIVVPFRDPQVGYVAAPSICDRNADHSWSARARLYAEAVLHGPTQAGHSGGFAPSCIGSHYAVRTAALREIGGLGPELAEDFTTTLMLSSHGWHGVFAADAEAHGEGPETLADCMTQEFQWSRSMMNVLLGINGRYWRGLRRTAKLRLGFCQIWYPMFAVLMLASVLIPLIAIITRSPPVRVSLGGFYAHFGPPIVVLLGVIVWLRRLQWLRPVKAKALSWEIMLFQIVRWPWVVLGCAHAVAGRIAGRQFAFKVTPKGRSGPAPLPIRILIPYLLIATISAVPAILRLDAGAAGGYGTLALINVGLYLFTAAAVLVLHIHDHPRALRWSALRHSVGKIAAAAGTTVVVVGGIVFPAAQLGLAWGGRTTPAPWPIDPARAPSVAIGVTTPALASNSTRAWTNADLGQVNAFEQAAHTHAAIVMWFADWQHGRVDPRQLHAVARRGSVPEISWEPWDYTVGLRRAQPRYTLASIIDGSHDAYIRSWAWALRQYGGPVLLRFAQEMNGSWYPWSEGLNGNRPGQFVKAWRHVHDLFVSMGATNVSWVWSPVSRYGLRLSTQDYPGAGYVDVLGLSGFNGGSALPWSGWRDFPSLFDASLAALHRIGPNTPIQISEAGSAEAGGDKAAWIAGMFRDIKQNPQVTSLIWFDVDKQADWRLASSRRAAAAFAAGVRTLVSPSPSHPSASAPAAQ